MHAKGEKIMNKCTKSKPALIAIILTALMMTSIAASALPNVSAHTPSWNIPTHAYIEATPDPVGVGQSMIIFMWVDQVFGAGFETNAVAALANNYRFHNYNLTIVAPDGNVTTKIFDTIVDSTSNQYMQFTPDQVGTYHLYFSFPGQAYAQYPGGYNPNSILVNDTYLPSNTSATLTVQEEPIPAALGSNPLPTEYWSRPIYGSNSDWWTISSNWLGTGAPVLSATGSGDITSFTTGPPMNVFGSVMQRYPGDAVGPLTSHIMWTTPLQTGGITGGNSVAIQGNTYFEGSAYLQRFTNPIIINGVLYYTEPIGFSGVTSGITKAVDLRTGQVIWARNDIPALSFGYVYDLETPNQHGVMQPILFTSNFARAFDAATGTPLFNVTGVPSGYEAMGPNGEHLRYVATNYGNATNPNWYLAQWNSSRLWDYSGYTPALRNASNGATWSMTGSSTPGNFIVNGNDVNISSRTYSYDWNVSLADYKASTAPTVLAAFYNNMLLIENGAYPASPSSFTTPSWTPYTYYGIDINTSKGHVGTQLWTKTVQPPAGNLTVYYAGADPVSGVFIETYKETTNFVGYSLTTGEKLWGPTESQDDWDYYGQPAPAQPYGQVANGKLYSSSYGGIVYCYDLTSGDIIWTYGNGGAGNSTYAGLNTPYGVYPTYLNAVGDDVLYLVSTEHTIRTPIYKGALARAINATTGEEIWTLSGYTGEFTAQSYAIADGYSVFLNGYDNQIYSVGKGPSATTISAPNLAADYGQAIVIRGAVTDIAAGTQQTSVKARFPNGVAVSSDASMKDWMGYVYQQQQMPTNFTGVPVSISVVDSNGNFRTVGMTTTDATGTYSYTWTPDIAGDFIVYASFAGSDGYYPSSAESTFTVAQQASTPTPTQNTASNIDSMFLPAVAAIIVAILLVGAILVVLMLRKH
jgi:outer membrane protein assembly factor BamB